MENTTNFEDYQVLFLEESQIHQELFDMWLPEIPTEFAPAISDFHSQFDSTVVVACLSQSLLGDHPERLRNHVLGRNPFCQMILIESPSLPTPESDPYDAVLERSISPDGLRETVEKRLKYGLYSTLLNEFYLLNAKLGSIERSGAVEEFENDLVASHCHDRLEEIKPMLNRLQRELNNEGIRELWLSISLHREYLTEPNPEIDAENTSKHHPNTCPKCRLPWGQDHGNELGVGFIPLGAKVWKCTRCDEIIHGVATNRKRVV